MTPHRPSRRRGEPALTWGAIVATTVTGLLLLGATSAPTSDLATAGPTVLSFVTPDSSALSVLTRVVLFVATAVVAGLGLTRALVGLRPSSPSSLQVARVAGATAGVSAMAGGLLGDAAWPWALTHLALVVAVVVLLPHGRGASTVGPFAVVLTAVLAAETAAGRHGPALPLELLGSVATTVALGIAVAATTEPAGALSGEGRFDRSARRRIVTTGLAAGVVASTAGVAMVLVEGPWTAHDLVAGPAGLAALARVVLPVLAVAVLVPGLRAGASGATGRVGSGDQRRREYARWSAIGLVGTIAAAAVLGAMPSSPDAPRAGQALLRPVQLGLERMAVLVAPSAGGATLMRISPAAGGGEGGAAAHADHRRAEPAPRGYAVQAGDAPSVTFTPRPGAPGAWALVDLPAGADEVTVTGPGGSATVPVTTAPVAPRLAQVLAGPDGPECADRLLGDLLGREAAAGPGPTTCPAGGLETSDGRALELAVTDLQRRGLRTLHLVGDDSARSREAEAVVRAAAARSGLRISATPGPDDGLLVLSGWAKAHATLTDVTARATMTPTFTGGQFLAPWLVTRGVLAAGSSTMFPLGFVPQEPTPRGFAAMLTTVFADAAPSSTGYLAWARAQGLSEGGVRLYGAAAMDVMPGMANMNHGDRAGAWLPGGSVIPISEVLS